MFSDVLVIFLNGIIEGLTEFIPVSSTGHLILLEHFFKLPLKSPSTFQISIQLGAILAVLVYYRQFFRDFLANSSKYPKLPLVFLAAIMPIFIFGYLAYDFIKTVLFSTPTVIAALIIGGIAMIACDFFYRKSSSPPSNSEKDLEAFSKISIKQGFIIGFFQLFSLWPGMSRSGSTIVGGVIAGLPYKTAADFSFCCGLPVITAAVLFDSIKSFGYISSHDIGYIALGMIISFCIGLFAIYTFLRWISSWKLTPFGIYRIILGFIVLFILT